MSPSPSRPVTPSSTSSSQPTTPSKAKGKNAAKRARAAAAKAAAAAAVEDQGAETELPGVARPEEEVELAGEAGAEPVEEEDPTAELEDPVSGPSEAGEGDGVGEQLPSEVGVEVDTPDEEVGDEFFEAAGEGEGDASASAVQAAEATIELVNLSDGNGLDSVEQLNLQRSPPHLPTLDQPPVPKLEDEYNSPPAADHDSTHHSAPVPTSPTSPPSSFPTDFPSTLSSDTPAHPPTTSHAHLPSDSPRSLTPPPSDPTSPTSSPPSPHDTLSPLPSLSLNPTPSPRERPFSLESEPETPTGPVSLAAMARKGSLPGLERKASVSTQNGQGQDGEGFADVSLAEIPAWRGKGKGRAVEGEEGEESEGEGEGGEKDLPGLPTPRRHSSAGSLDSANYMFLMQRLEAQ